MLPLLLITLSLLLSHSVRSFPAGLCGDHIFTDIGGQQTYVIGLGLFETYPSAPEGTGICGAIGLISDKFIYYPTLDLYNTDGGTSTFNYQQLTSALSACTLSGMAFLNGPSLSGEFCLRVSTDWPVAVWSDCTDTMYQSSSIVPFVCGLSNPPTTVSETVFVFRTDTLVVPTLSTTTATTTTTTIDLFIPTTTTSTSLILSSTLTTTSTTSTTSSTTTSITRTTKRTTSTIVSVEVTASTETSTVQQFTETTTTTTSSTISKTSTTDTLFTCPVPSNSGTLVSVSTI